MIIKRMHMYTHRRHRPIAFLKQQHFAFNKTSKQANHFTFTGNPYNRLYKLGQYDYPHTARGN